MIQELVNYSNSIPLLMIALSLRDLWKRRKSVSSLCTLTSTVHVVAGVAFFLALVYDSCVGVYMVAATMWIFGYGKNAALEEVLVKGRGGSHEVRRAP